MKRHLNQFKQPEINSNLSSLTLKFKNVIRRMNFIYILEVEKQFITLSLVNAITTM